MLQYLRLHCCGCSLDLLLLGSCGALELLLLQHLLRRLLLRDLLLQQLNLLLLQQLLNEVLHVNCLGHRDLKTQSDMQNLVVSWKTSLLIIFVFTLVRNTV